MAIVGPVHHFRPALGDVIKTSFPVGATEWRTLAALANWLNGHGHQQVPFHHVGLSDSATMEFHYYFEPKRSATTQMWLMVVRGPVGTTFDVEVDGTVIASTVSPIPTTRDGRLGGFVFQHWVTESSAPPAHAPAESVLKITPNGGSITVESIGMYEQTRRVLQSNTADYGVDPNTVRHTSPIADFDYQSVAGVVDAYKNVDARRASHFAWATPTGDAIAVSAVTATDLFPLSVPVLGHVPFYGNTQCEVTVYAYARLVGTASGEAYVKYTADQSLDTVTLTVTSGTWTWWSDVLLITAEDIDETDGRRASTWEGLDIDAWTANASFPVQIAGLACVRTSTNAEADPEAIMTEGGADVTTEGGVTVVTES